MRTKHLLSILSLCVVVVVSGCVTTPDDIVSRWHTIQNGPMCTTVAEDQNRFNSETVEPRSIECSCSQLVTIKRLVVKAGESPEAWSCPEPIHLAMNNSVMIESKSLHHRASLAATYIPSATDLLGDIALGSFLYAGLSKVRMTQSVGGLTINETFSTKYVGK